MQKIQLSGKHKDKYTLVDNEDFEIYKDYKLHLNSEEYIYFSKWDSVTKKVKSTRFHRAIMNFPIEMLDHINQNKLDNRKSNLRICTYSQNNANRKSVKGSSSIFKGVYWNKIRKYWQSCIGINGKTKHLGCYNNELNAARAYNEAAIELFGEFARLNSI